MPTSSNLSNVLQGIANPAIADIPGAIGRGQDRRIAGENQQMALDDRQKKADIDAMLGEILGATVGGKIGALGKVDPSAALELSKALEIPLNAKQRMESMLGDIQIAAAIYESGDPRGAAQYAAEKASMLENLGIRPTQYLETIKGLMSNDPAEVEATGNSLIQLRDSFVASGALKSPGADEKFSEKSEVLVTGATIQTSSTGRRIVKDPFGNVVTGEAAARVIAEANNEGVRLESARAGGRASATEDERRVATAIEQGMAAAESAPIIRRALSIMDTVITGGMAAFTMEMRKTLGIEGADEGELSNSLGKTSLSQLKSIFGAQFTEAEGARLERIEAGFSKSPENNKRLLGQALRIVEQKIARARRIAIKRGLSDVVEDLDDLSSFSLDIPADQKPVSRFNVVEIVE